jgi:hypothetical protein
MKERLKLLARQLEYTGVRVVHYPQTKICQEQYMFYFYLSPNCEDYTIFSTTCGTDKPLIYNVDSLYTVILSCTKNNLHNEFVSFENFFEGLTNEHKEIFCFYLDLFNDHNFINQ